MTPEYLKEVLPSLLNADLAEATNIRLLSLARAYAALCSLATFDAPDGEYGTRATWLRKINTLFGVLRERCRRESDVPMRCRMVHVMYTLVCETMSGSDLKKKEVCFAIMDELVHGYIGDGHAETSLLSVGVEPLEQTSICDCIIDLLYPAPDAGDEYLLFLKRQIAGWTAETDRAGSWPGVSPDVALERIAVMDRYSCMFLDKTNDGAVKRSFEYWRRSLRVPEDTGNFEPNYLHTLGRLYDAVSQGRACPADKAAAQRIAGFMYDYSRILPARNDAWFYCTAYIIHCIAEGIEARLEAEMERHIA